MESLDEETQTTLLPFFQSADTPKQCSFDMSVFDHDRLLKNTIYQRLVDIVSTDHIHPKHDFRIGFIKELYFLLRVTPILSEKIQDEYLDLVEKWYNKNDGKKIEIGSQKLNNLYAAVAAHKDEANLRPKSGLACQQQFWDKEIPSFLRPYTAKQRVHELMPNGCKTEQGSTLAGTEDLYLREWNLSVQEEIEISQDFLNKARTIYPRQDPVYERLREILQKVFLPTQILEPVPSKPSRFTRSAIPKKNLQRRKLTNKSLKQFQFQDQAEGDINEIEHINEIEQADEQQKEDEQESDGKSENEEYLFVSEEIPYIAYSKPNILPSSRPGLTPALKNIQSRNRNLQLQRARQDISLPASQVHYLRAKSALRRETNRKTESSRMFFSRSVKRIQLNHSANNLFENDYKTPIYNIESSQVRANKIDPYPTYNKKQYFSPKLSRAVLQHKKSQPIQFQDATARAQGDRGVSMTFQTGMLNNLRFDPISNDNVRKYNKEALQEIEKIKWRLGSKVSAGNTLMKALTICEGGEFLEKVDWKDRYIGYNMLSNGVKPKKLKKGRKINKPKK